MCLSLKMPEELLRKAPRWLPNAPVMYRASSSRHVRTVPPRSIPLHVRGARRRGAPSLRLSPCACGAAVIEALASAKQLLPIMLNVSNLNSIDRRIMHGRQPSLAALTRAIPSLGVLIQSFVYQFVHSINDCRALCQKCSAISPRGWHQA